MDDLNIPQPARARVQRFLGSDLRPFVEQIPDAHRQHVQRIVDDFAAELGRLLGNLSTPKACERAVLKLLRMAIQREAVVGVAYRPARAPQWLDQDLVRRVLVRIWDDEIIHEAYLCAITHDLPWMIKLQKQMGKAGGDAGAVLAGAKAGVIRTIKAHAVRVAGRLTGLIGPEVAAGLRAEDLASWSAQQAALELTALVAYQTCDVLLHELHPMQAGFLTLRPERLSRKLLEIAKEEQQHAELFAAICRAECRLTAAGDEDLLAGAARLVTTPGAWPQPARLAPVPRHTARNPRPAAQALRELLPRVDWTSARRVPIVTLVCDTPLDKLRSLRSESVIGSLLTALAIWCRENGRDAQAWVLGPGPSQDKGPAALLGTGMQALHVASLRACEDPSSVLAGAQLVTAGGTELLTTHGTFVTSNADVLHRAWDMWAAARLRLCVSQAQKAFDTLGQVVHSRLDYQDSPSLEGTITYVDIPGLRELAALRLLGACPPDFCVLRGTPRRQLIFGSDLVELGTAAGDGLHNDAWRAAQLAATQSPPGERAP
jgi:hypothetical protein